METGDAHNFPKILADHVCASSWQFRDHLINVAKGVGILDLPMQLPGDRAALVADLKNNLGGRVRKRHGTEILLLLRGQDQAETELPALTKQLFHRRSL